MQQGHGVRRDDDYSALSRSLAMLTAVLFCVIASLQAMLLLLL
jgi:hypothetical protein